MIRWKRSWPDLSESPPIDVMPASNGEFVPEAPTEAQRAIMALQNEEIERVRRRFRMSRRDFVRSAAAYTIGLWAINQVNGTQWGRYAFGDDTRTNGACDLEWPGAQMNNLPGEFIFDVQSHHVESDGLWRVTNPGFHAFFAAIWSQAGGVTASGDNYWLRGDITKGVNAGGAPDPLYNPEGFTPTRGGREVDPIENLSRYHYLKELYLDSSTNMTVLSAVPAEESNNPLPILEAAHTVGLVNNTLARSQRCVMHAFVMPNRGSFGTLTTSSGQLPLFMQEEFDRMEALARAYGPNGDVMPGALGGWKTYTAWGDVPYASGWYFDDEIGTRFFEQVRKVAQTYGGPNVVAVHKGFALPAFDQRAASPRDIGPAARAFPDVNIVVYHSGYDTETQLPYPGDDAVNSSDRSVDAFIKSLRENGLIAANYPGGNIPNVYAEIGSTWRSVMRDANQAAHLLGKLITHVGPRRICWGTDSLWFGSPQSEIVALRAFEFSQAAKDFYGLPYGLEGDIDNPKVRATDPKRTIKNGIFGRNAAEAYSIDPDAVRNVIDCDQVQAIRDEYLINPGTPRERAPYSSNRILGPRTPQQLFKMRNESPWSP